MVCFFFVDPDQDSDSIHPFWTPKANPYIIKCLTRKAQEKDAAKGFLLSEIACNREIVQLSEGSQHLLLYDKHFSLQLDISGDADISKRFHFEVSALGPALLSYQTQSINCLETLVRLRKFGRKCVRAAPKRIASTETLFAFDLASLGISQRQIALKLFGYQAVMSGWEDVSDHIRSKTRRLIKKGRGLVKRGYAAIFPNF